VRELLNGPQSCYKPSPKNPQFLCGCLKRERASHPWYNRVELRVSPALLELPKSPLPCPPHHSPPFRSLLRQSAKFSPFLPVRLASAFSSSLVPREARKFSSRFAFRVVSSRRVVSFVASRPPHPKSQPSISVLKGCGAEVCLSF
jgi:hypothetical protein